MENSYMSDVHTTAKQHRPIRYISHVSAAGIYYNNMRFTNDVLLISH